MISLRKFDTIYICLYTHIDIHAHTRRKSIHLGKQFVERTKIMSFKCKNYAITLQEQIAVILEKNS